MSQGSVVTEDKLSPNLRQLWQKARAAIDARNYGYAITLLQTILQQEPSFLDGRRYLRGACAKKRETGKKALISTGGLGLMQVKSAAKKDPQSAIVALEKFLENDPFNVQGNELLYELATSCGMPETATFALETIYDGHPDNKKNGHRLAEHYLTNNLPDRAAAIYNDMVRRDPTDIRAAKGATDATARHSMTQNKWDSSTSFKDLIKSKDEAQALEQDARAAMTPEQIDEQLARLGEKYEQDPNDLNLVKRIADLCEKKEDFQSALSYYEWAFHLSSSDSALENKVVRLRDKVRDLGIHALEEDLAANPDTADAEQKRKELEELKHQRAITMIDDAKRRVERNPTDPQLRFELGTYLYEDGQYSEAIQQLQRAKNSPHARVKVLYTLGKCFAAKNMNDLAVTQLEQASEELSGMDTTKKEILYNLAMVYEKMGNHEKYLDSLKQIYEADYGYLDVAQRVESSYAQG